jgi:hypothetical protein
MRSNIEPPREAGFARAVYPAPPDRRAAPDQLSLTIAITIEAIKQATRMTRQMAQRRGTARS